MSFCFGFRRPKAAPPFGISMLGGSEFRLRRGFTCGKTLVRCKSAAAQKGTGQKTGWGISVNNSKTKKMDINRPFQKRSAWFAGASFLLDTHSNRSGKGAELLRQPPDDGEQHREQDNLCHNHADGFGDPGGQHSEQPGPIHHVQPNAV